MGKKKKAKRQEQVETPIDNSVARTVQGISPSNPMAAEIWGLSGYMDQTAGVSVNENSAQNVTTLFAAITLLAQTLAALPVGCFRKTKEDDRENADQHPANYLFNKSPDDVMTAYNYREALQGHILLRGNGYSEIVRNFRGQAIELYLLDPRAVHPRIDIKTKVPVYDYAQPSGRPIELDRTEIQHIPNFSTNGIIGLPPLTVYRETLGLTIAANRYASEYFAKGGRPLGFLTKPTLIQRKERDSLRDEWQEMHGGIENSNQVGILSGGLDWKNIGMSNNDAQLLELRQFQKYEIATMFRIPPFLLGDTSQPISSIEFIMLQFAIFTLLPWMKRWESEMNFKLFTPKERFNYYLEFNSDGMLRGDAKSRSEALKAELQNGALTVNEWRRIMNRSPIEGGNVPLIMASQIAKLEDVISGKANLDTTNKKSQPADKQVNRILAAYKKLPPNDKSKVRDLVISLNGIHPFPSESN